MSTTYRAILVMRDPDLGRVEREVTEEQFENFKDGDRLITEIELETGDRVLAVYWQKEKLVTAEVDNTET